MLYRFVRTCVILSADRCPCVSNFIEFERSIRPRFFRAPSFDLCAVLDERDGSWFILCCYRLTRVTFLEQFGYIYETTDIFLFWSWEKRSYRIRRNEGILHVFRNYRHVDTYTLNFSTLLSLKLVDLSLITNNVVSLCFLQSCRNIADYSRTSSVWVSSIAPNFNRSMFKLTSCGISFFLEKSVEMCDSTNKMTSLYVLKFTSRND